MESGLKGGTTFQLRNLFGSRVIRVNNLPPGWLLKTVRLNGQDVTDKPIDLTGMAPISGVDVVVTSRGGEVSGTALDAAGRPLPEGAVIVFAADSARWAAPSRFVKMATLDERGGFRVAGLPAASYLAVAVARLAPDWERPAVLEGLQGVASPFALAEGERQTLAIRVKERR